MNLSIRIALYFFSRSTIVRRTPINTCFLTTIGVRVGVKTMAALIRRESTREDEPFS